MSDAFEIVILRDLEQFADGPLLEAGQFELLGRRALDLPAPARLGSRHFVAVEIQRDAGVDGRGSVGRDLVAELLDRDRVLGRRSSGRPPGPGGPLFSRCLFDGRGRAYRQYRLPAGQRAGWGGLVAAPNMDGLVAASQGLETVTGLGRILDAAYPIE